jgi:D-serine deaminase-like pyridoxal phosphate-dependent protein
MRIQDLPTPCVLVDLDRVEANTAAMLQRASRLGVQLRPHVKTHKCVEAARLQVGADGGAITVSTLAEARYFSDAGFGDITLAVPLSPRRIPEAVQLGGAIKRLNLLVDNPDTIAALATEAHRVGQTVPVFLKVDCGYGRAGVVPGERGALRVADALHHSDVLDFRGLLTHGGHSYDCRNRTEIAQVAAQERDAVVGFAQALIARGIPIPEVSVGSTPTMMVAENLDGVTEIRPGNYAMFDATQAAIGSCGPEDVAVTVLSSVIGEYPRQSRLLLDAGALALSMDPGPVHVDPNCGYGVVYGLDGRTPLPALELVELSQEHGKVKVNGTVGLHTVGTRIRIQPNHSCLTLALYDQFHLVRGNEVVDTWIPCRGW